MGPRRQREESGLACGAQVAARTSARCGGLRREVERGRAGRRSAGLSGTRRWRAGPRWVGPVWAERGEGLIGSGRAGKGGERVGPDLGVGLGFGFGFLSFSISFVFLTQTTQLFEFKNKFEFNPNTQTNKRDAPA